MPRQATPKRVLSTPITFANCCGLRAGHDQADVGGAGIYAGRPIFAIAIDGVIYLKADEETVPAFKRGSLAPFTYGAKKKWVVMSYWRMPDRLCDDPKELAQWSKEAVAAAGRAAAGKAGERRVNGW